MKYDKTNALNNELVTRKCALESFVVAKEKEIKSLHDQVCNLNNEIH